MENKKKYLIIGIVVVLCVILVILVYPKKEGYEEEIAIDSSIPEEKKNELEEIKVTGYHLVTYAQSANSNSFVKSMTVTASLDGKVRFVIGTIDDHSVVQERISFELDCKKGENTFDLLSKRHLVKEGEYLMMDIYGQDVLYTQKGSNTKSFVQSENKKVSGKMIMNDSNYILPFQYTLEKIKDYHALVIGNDITTNNRWKRFICNRRRVRLL